MKSASINNRAPALMDFVKRVYAPGLHIAFALGWFLSLEGFLVLVKGEGKSWILDSKVSLGILSVFLILFFLRVVDEIKDFEYDKIYNPDRPLVQGVVTFQDLYAFLLGTAAAVIILNIFLSRILVLILILEMIYALFLIQLEKFSVRVREDILINLLVTYPVNIALSIYIYLFFLIQYNLRPGTTDIFILIAFALAFLHYEIGRKTCWPHHAPKGKRLYSSALGSRGSAFTALSCALAASAITLGLIQPWKLVHIKAMIGWLLCFPLLPAFWGTYRFFSVKSRSKAPKPAAVISPWAMFFLSLYYVTLIILAVILTKVSFQP